MTGRLIGKPTVVVVGGGYGGTAVAKALDETTDVVLVEPKDAFMHNVAALRALVDPSWLPKIFFPYAGLLTNGRVVRDRAASVDPHRVVTASGEEICGRLRRPGHRIELSLPGQDRSRRHPPRSGAGPRTHATLRRRIGSSWSAPARSASSWPERSVTSGRRSRSSCSTPPTRFSAVRSCPSSGPNSDASSPSSGSSCSSAARCASPADRARRFWNLHRDDRSRDGGRRPTSGSAATASYPTATTSGTHWRRPPRRRLRRGRPHAAGRRSDNCLRPRGPLDRRRQDGWLRRAPGRHRGGQHHRPRRGEGPTSPTTSPWASPSPCRSGPPAAPVSSPDRTRSSGARSSPRRRAGT